MCRRSGKPIRPEECASIRSIPRWVFPVLVGPSTAVTPAPRARKSRSAGGEKEIGINSPAWRRVLVYHNVTLERPVLNMWNESGTNRGRIGDSRAVRVRSPRYVAPRSPLNTRSGVACGFAASFWRPKR